MRWLIKSHLIKIYAVCKFSYFRLWYLKSLSKHFLARLDEVQEELFTTPGIGIGVGGCVDVTKMLKFLR